MYPNTDIRIIPANKAKIEQALAEVQHGCRSRLLTADDVFRLARVAETRLSDLGIEKSDRLGARYAHAQSRGGYGTGRCLGSTRVVLERVHRGWKLIEVLRAGYRPGEPGEKGIYLTYEQRKEAVRQHAERFARTLKLACDIESR